MGKLFYGTMTGNTAAVAEAIQAALADLIDEARCIDRAKAESHGLGLFIRALVGLDREAAKAGKIKDLFDQRAARR